MIHSESFVQAAIGQTALSERKNGFAAMNDFVSLTGEESGSDGKKLARFDGYNPRRGYNLGAPFYDQWIWQRLWASVEWPIVDHLLSASVINYDHYSTVLDIGTGTGASLQRIHEKYPTTTMCGIDISENMLTIAERKLKKNARLFLSDATQGLAAAENSIDVVLLCRVASHIEFLDGLVSEIGRVLTKRGMLIVTDIDPSHPYRCTSLPTAGNKISIETHKHTLEDWRVLTEAVGLGTVHEYKIRSDKLGVIPDSAIPPSIVTGSPHQILYIICAKKLQ